MPTFHFRVAAGRGAGLGHLMRSLAVMEEAARRGWDCTLWIRGSPFPGLRGLLGNVRLGWVSSDSSGWIDAISSGDVVVVDDYEITSVGLRSIGERGSFTCVMSDFDHFSDPADMLVVPSHRVVAAENVAVKLCGPDFVPLRTGVTRLRRRRRAALECLLLFFGGSDIADLASLLLPPIAAAGAFPTINLIVGPTGAPPVPTSGSQINHLPMQDSAEVFAEQDAAIVAAGTIVWELLYLGVPTAFVVTAENQRGLAEIVGGANAAIDLGVPASAAERVTDCLELLRQPVVRRSQSKAGRDLVDGLGAKRIVDQIAAAL